MNIHLTPDLDDELKALRKEEMRKKIAEGMASLQRGESVDGEQVFARIEKEIDALENSGHT